MSTVFLAWQTPTETRAWYPIGRLEHHPEDELFRFGYTGGATRAREQAGLKPLDSFPNFETIYEDRNLFPFFQNRLLSKKRPDYKEYMSLLDLPLDSDPLDILSVSGGIRATDNLEIFPEIRRGMDGRFHCRFFLHGWRYVNEIARERINHLKLDEKLRVSIELNNPSTQLAIQVMTEDYVMLGWSPRYLVGDLINVVNEANSEIRARVAKVNASSGNLQQKVLIELTGKWPSQNPFDNEDFKFIGRLDSVNR